MIACSLRNLRLRKPRTADITTAWTIWGCLIWTCALHGIEAQLLVKHAGRSDYWIHGIKTLQLCLMLCMKFKWEGSLIINCYMTLWSTRTPKLVLIILLIGVLMKLRILLNHYGLNKSCRSMRIDKELLLLLLLWKCRLDLNHPCVDELLRLRQLLICSLHLESLLLKLFNLLHSLLRDLFLLLEFRNCKKSLVSNQLISIEALLHHSLLHQWCLFLLLNFFPICLWLL
jgi:hypothetical protein